MTALALVQNEGAMSSPSDLMVTGLQVIATSQQNIVYKSDTKCSGFPLSVESNRATTVVLAFVLIQFEVG